MIGGGQVLALVVGRGGSKGLPGKNLRLLGGRPLIAWSVLAARASRHVDRVVVSSDDPAIAEAARAAGAEAPFLRPAALAGDETPVAAAVLHALDALAGEFAFIVLLQATSPLRTGEDVDRCIERCHGMGATRCVSVCESAKPPQWMFRLDETGRMSRLMAAGPEARRRQDLPRTYVLNGAVYVARVAAFRADPVFVDDATFACPMPAERSVDIDTALDFRLAELLLAERNETIAADAAGARHA